MTNLAKYLSLAVLPLIPLASSGCYDQGDIEECVGLSCANGFQWPFGGELRIWYISLPDGSELRRFIGFFIESQTPDILPDPEVGYCVLDTGEEPGVGFGTNASYLDVGSSITFDTGDMNVNVPRVTDDGPVEDYAGRTNDIAYMREISEPTGDGFFNSSHAITTADSVNFEDTLTPGVFMPSEVEIIQPIGTPVIALQAGQDLTIDWREVEPTNPKITTGGAIVFIPDAGPAWQCIVANTGHFVVPSEVIDAFGADTGVMVIGTATNQGVLRPDGRFQSMFGMNCHLSPYQRSH